MTFCAEPLLLLPPLQLPAMHLFPQPAQSSLKHAHTHIYTLRHVDACGFQLGFTSLKTQCILTDFDSEGFHIELAVVMDTHQLLDVCCFDVSLMADHNR